MQSSFQELINVYLRNAKKEARLINIKTPIKSQELLSITSQQMNIPIQDIILYYNGFRIDNYTQHIHLNDRSIIHVINKRKTNQPQILISLKANGWNGRTFKISISPQKYVRQLISDHIVPRYDMQQQQLFVVYVGKVLKLNNKLIQQFIQDGSQLLVFQHRPIKQLFKKQALQFQIVHSNPNVRRQDSGNDGMPVSYQINKEKMAKNKQKQQKLKLQHAKLQQKQAKQAQDLKVNKYVAYLQDNAAPSNGNSQDSFFKQPNSDNKIPTPQQKKSSQSASVISQKSKILPQKISSANQLSKDQQIPLLLAPPKQDQGILKIQSNQTISIASQAAPRQVITNPEGKAIDQQSKKQVIIQIKQASPPQHIHQQ